MKELEIGRDVPCKRRKQSSQLYATLTALLSLHAADRIFRAALQ